MDKQKQDPKLYLLMPVPCVIVAVIIFYLFGGGSGQEDQNNTEEKKLLNTEVPDEGEGFISQIKDKLTTYEQQAKDALAYENEKRKDPYSKLLGDDEMNSENVLSQGKEFLKQPNQLSFNMKPVGKEDSLVQSLNDEEEKLKKQIMDLEKIMQDKPVLLSPKNHPNRDRVRESQAGSRVVSPSLMEQHTFYNSEGLASAPGVQAMPPEVQAQFAAYDQAASQLMEEENQQFADMKDMLDKILDIQHPERVKQRHKEQSKGKTGRFQPVQSSKNYVPVDYLGEKEDDLYRDRYYAYIDLNRDTTYKVVPHRMVSGFMGLSSQEGNRLKDQVKAVVHNGSIVTDGSKVKLRLLSNIVVQGREVRANSYVYGTCSINGPRVNVEVTSIQVAGNVVPVNMQVYDHDGMEGIYVNGLAAGQAAREAATNAGTNLDLQLANPTLGGRLIDNSVREVRNLLRRNAQAPKAKLKSGHQIFLLNADF